MTRHCDCATCNIGRTGGIIAMGFLMFGIGWFLGDFFLWLIGR